MALILSQKNWAYTLYEIDEKYVFSVVCGSVAIYELNIPLTDEEKNKFLSNPGYLQELSNEIMNNPSKFSSRSIILNL